MIQNCSSSCQGWVQLKFEGGAACKDDTQSIIESKCAKGIYTKIFGFLIERILQYFYQIAS